MPRTRASHAFLSPARLNVRRKALPFCPQSDQDSPYRPTHGLLKQRVQKLKLLATKSASPYCSLHPLTSTYSTSLTAHSVMDVEMSNAPSLRARSGHTAGVGSARPTVRIIAPPTSTLHRFQRQRNRILHFQRRWARIKEDLPPQLSRKHSKSALNVNSAPQF